MTLNSKFSPTLHRWRCNRFGFTMYHTHAKTKSLTTLWGKGYIKVSGTGSSSRVVHHGCHQCVITGSSCRSGPSGGGSQTRSDGGQRSEFPYTSIGEQETIIPGGTKHFKALWTTKHRKILVITLLGRLKIPVPT